MNQGSLFNTNTHLPLLRKISNDTYRLNLKVVPKSKTPGVKGLFCNNQYKMLVIHSSAPPEDNKANKDIINILAKHIGIAPQNISLESGHTHRQKSVIISSSISQEALEEKLLTN